MPRAVNPGSTRLTLLVPPRRVTASRALRPLVSAILGAALTACATSGASIGTGRVSIRGGADSALAAAVAREQSGGATTSSAIGVPPFQLLAKSEGVSALGFAIADLLTTDLSRSSRVSLVERSRLSDVLRELDLAKTGRIDSATAPRAGKLMRAKRLVLGSVDTMSKGNLRISVRVADVESGVLDASLDAQAPLADVLSAEKALAFRLFEALGIALTPAERATISAYPTTSLAALNAYGRGVQAEIGGDRRRAIDEFNRAAVVDPAFQQARDRSQQLKSDARRSADAPSVLPGMRAIDAPINGTVDRVNRPIDIITSLSRPLGGAADPSFPSSIVTVVITVARP